MQMRCQTTHIHHDNDLVCYRCGRTLVNNCKEAKEEVILAFGDVRAEMLPALLKSFPSRSKGFDSEI